MVCETELLKKIKLAEEGRNIWNALAKHGTGNNCRFVIFPHKDIEYKKIFQKRLNDYIKLFDLSKICIIQTEEKVDFHTDEQCEIEQIILPQEQVEKIIMLYELCEFTNLLCVMSVEVPEGRCGNKVMERNGITLDEVITYGILGFDNRIYNIEKG